MYESYSARFAKPILRLTDTDLFNLTILTICGLHGMDELLFPEAELVERQLRVSHQASLLLLLTGLFAFHFFNLEVELFPPTQNRDDALTLTSFNPRNRLQQAPRLPRSILFPGPRVISLSAQESWMGFYRSALERHYQTSLPSWPQQGLPRGGHLLLTDEGDDSDTSHRNAQFSDSESDSGFDSGFDADSEL